MNEPCPCGCAGNWHHPCVAGVCDGCDKVRVDVEEVLIGRWLCPYCDGKRMKEEDDDDDEE